MRPAITFLNIQLSNSRTENKFTTVKIFYDFLLQRLKRCLLVLVTWKNIKFPLHFYYFMLYSHL